MGKKNKPTTPESALLMPKHPALQESTQGSSNGNGNGNGSGSGISIVDTHCHLLSTYSFYRSKYPEGDKHSVQDFVRAYFAQKTSNEIEGVVDVYCEPPFTGWKESVTLQPTSIRIKDRRTKTRADAMYTFENGCILDRSKAWPTLSQTHGTA